MAMNMPQENERKNKLQNCACGENYKNLHFTGNKKACDICKIHFGKQL